MFLAVINDYSPEETQTKNSSDQRIINLLSATGKVMAGIPSWRLEYRIEYLKENQFGFKKGIGTKNTI